MPLFGNIPIFFAQSWETPVMPSEFYLDKTLLLDLGEHIV